MSLQVIRDRVIVATESQTESVTPSGIITVELEAPRVVGRVVACAPDAGVAVDDVVIFAPTAGQLLQHDGADYLVLELDEIDAVYEEGATV